MIDLNVRNAIIPVIQEFERLGIPYYIGGSVASCAYGVPWMTLDVAMVADIAIQHVQSLVKSLGDSHYIDGDMIKDAINYASSFSMVHLDSIIRVDISCAKAKPYDQETMRRRRPLMLDENTPDLLASFASPEDVVLAKLQWYMKGGSTSIEQWNDILGVLEIQHSKLDKDYLIHWAAELGVDSLLAKAFQDAKSAIGG